MLAGSGKTTFHPASKSVALAIMVSNLNHNGYTVAVNMLCWRMFRSVGGSVHLKRILKETIIRSYEWMDSKTQPT